MSHVIALCTALAVSTSLAAQSSVTLKVPGATLSGTLQLPAPNTGRVPVVLILPGSGPTDRDGNSAAGPAGTYRKLAAHLAEHGIASLRVDKRGIGQSVADDPSEEAMSFADAVNDARAWLGWLTTQPQLGPVGLIGHSEGGLVALAALQQGAPANALILLAAPGESIGATVRRQITQNPANPPALAQEAETILSRLEHGERVQTVSPVLMPLFRPSVQPYLMSVLTYDPVKLMAGLRLPTLVLQGDRDLQVRPVDATLLSAAQDGAQLQIISGMNHVLVDAPADLQENLKTYADPAAPLSAAALQTIDRFLKQVFMPDR